MPPIEPHSTFAFHVCHPDSEHVRLYDVASSITSRLDHVLKAVASWLRYTVVVDSVAAKYFLKPSHSPVPEGANDATHPPSL